ncbi:elongator complex protein 5 isoform X2 [Polyodon spathula]|uniref:elongator complex protein 5 isoform X2 n=1 Tax=Polyodon spathula TaxID=7913 RepID=UPI001B7DACF5|nr:elongator complex protein 5 isoform X2 [Polyodon spathula]
MLVEIIQGTEGGGLIVIKDSSECDGRSLLKGFIKAALQRNEPVHVVGFEVSENELRTGLDSGAASRLVFHDGYSDPLQWLGQGKLSVQDYSAQNTRNRISQTDDPKLVTLIIDSLSWLLLHTPPTAVCQSLQELSRGGMKVKRVIALLHSDLHEQGVVGSVCHVATAVVTVTPVSGSVSGEAEPNGIVRTLQRRKTGKVSQEEECYSVREDFSVQILRDLGTKKQPAPHRKGETKQEVIIASASLWRGENPLPARRQ